MMPEQLQPARILAIHVARIGDTLLTTAALRHLSRVYPDAEIDFLGHPKRIEVLEHLPYLHRIGSISKKSARVKGWCARFMRRKPYDLAVVWGHDPALVAYARRISKVLVAGKQLQANANTWPDIVVDFPNDTNLLAETEDKPLVKWLLDIAEQATQTEALNVYTDYVVTVAEAKTAQALLAQLNGGPFIGLVVESHPAGAHRNWPIEHFAELLGLLAKEKPHAAFVLIGGPLNENKAQLLGKNLGKRLLNLTGKLSLRQSAAVISQCDLYIGVDTGPSHLAAALGTPSVVMFHCMRSGELLLAPRYPERLTIVNHPTTRLACSFETSMSVVTVDQVMAACQQQLQSGHQLS